MLFNGNFGQHMAIMAGFAQVRGRRVVTLDADLQNPPEEIARLLERMDAGHDYVGTIRRDRQDSFFRRVASRAMNRVRERITRIHMTDQGCMMRAYSREIVDAMGSSREVNTFIPALAYTFAANPTEILVAHEERHAGTSKYPLSKLLRLNFDLITGFSIVPLQAVSVIGMLISVMAATMFLLLVLRRLFIGPEAEGIFSLFAVNFLLHGMELLGLGLLGEYVGRVYLQVRERPRYLIQAILEERPAAPAAEPRAP